jgi:hypothetical protein
MAFIRSRSSLYRAKGISPSNAKIFSEGWKSVAPLSVLARCSGGDREAFESLVRLVCDDLRRIAHRRLQSERTDITLHTTAVVHEAYLALVDQATATWNDRAHFFAVAARVIKFLDPGEEDVLHLTRTGIQPLRSKPATAPGGP